MFTACNDGGTTPGGDDEERTPVNFTLDPDRDYGLYWYDVNGGRMLSQEDMNPPSSTLTAGKPTSLPRNSSPNRAP